MLVPGARLVYVGLGDRCPDRPRTRRQPGSPTVGDQDLVCGGLDGRHPGIPVGARQHGFLVVEVQQRIVEAGTAGQRGSGLDRPSFLPMEPQQHHSGDLGLAEGSGSFSYPAPGFGELLVYPDALDAHPFERDLRVRRAERLPHLGLADGFAHVLGHLDPEVESVPDPHEAWVVRHGF